MQLTDHIVFLILITDLKEEFHKSQINHELLIQEKVAQIQQLQQMNNDLESNFKSNDLMALENYSKLTKGSYRCGSSSCFCCCNNHAMYFMNV